MLKRRLFLSSSLAALYAGHALAREPVTLVLAIPANRSPHLDGFLRPHIAHLYRDLTPGDRLVVVNASTQGTVALVEAGDLGDNDVDRDEALLDQFAPITRFLGVNDNSVPVDNCNIPATLRTMKNVLALFPDRKANVVIFGSLNWENKKDAKWTFKDVFVLDGFLNQQGGAFGVVGEEDILRGALVSILFTDAPDAFLSTGGEQWVQKFWGKSIKGRGGRVGAIEAYDAGSYQRFFSTVEDTTPYVIDADAARAIMVPGWRHTPTYVPGQAVSGNDAPPAISPAKPRPVRPTATKPHPRPAAATSTAGITNPVAPR
jgi:hypothetical protein